MFDAQEKALPERGFATLADAESYGEHTQVCTTVVWIEVGAAKLSLHSLP
jgi:hypothetical protein